MIGRSKLCAWRTDFNRFRFLRRDWDRSMPDRAGYFCGKEQRTPRCRKR